MSRTQVTIVGNLTSDPELRFTPSGASVVKFAVAVNRQVFDRETNAWKDAGTDFHNVTAWRKLAENCAATLEKGSRVVVVGDLRQRTWTDDKTNEKRYAWELNAEAVGAELTFATAKVTKTTKNETAPDDPWSTGSKERPPAAAAAPGSWPQGSGPRGPQGGYTDEPPF
jgi:single-strand DNA-binding protein